MNCHKCGFEIATDAKINRQNTCPKCGSYLHCCLNCHFYDPAAYHQCREPQAEWVKEKEMGNFCEYFTPRTAGVAQTGLSKEEEARKKLEQLFKKK